MKLVKQEKPEIIRTLYLKEKHHSKYVLKTRFGQFYLDFVAQKDQSKSAIIVRFLVYHMYDVFYLHNKNKKYFYC